MKKKKNEMNIIPWYEIGGPSIYPLPATGTMARIWDEDGSTQTGWTCAVVWAIGGPEPSVGWALVCVG